MKTLLLLVSLLLSTVTMASLTGSLSNLVDVSSNQTIDGTKTFTSPVAASVTGSAATVTTIGAGQVTNANLAGSIDLPTKVTGRLPKASAPLREVPSSDMTGIKTSNYTIGANDYVVLVDSQAGLIDFQLPDPAAGRRELVFINAHYSNGEGFGYGFNLLRYGSEKIGGTAATKFVYAGFVWVVVISDGTNWHVAGMSVVDM